MYWMIKKFQKVLLFNSSLQTHIAVPLCGQETTEYRNNKKDPKNNGYKKDPKNNDLNKI